MIGRETPAAAGRETSLESIGTWAFSIVDRALRLEVQIPPPPSFPAALPLSRSESRRHVNARFPVWNGIARRWKVSHSWLFRSPHVVYVTIAQYPVSRIKRSDLLLVINWITVLSETKLRSTAETFAREGFEKSFHFQGELFPS